MLIPWKKSCDKPRQCVEKQGHHLANKGPYRQSYGFFSSHVRMWELDHKEGWAPKNWCFCTMVLEKFLESPLNCKVIKLVHPKGNQPRTFTGRSDAEAEAPILWPPDVKNWLIRKKTPDAGKDWGQEKRVIEDEMVGWHHRLIGQESEQTPGDSEGQEVWHAAVYGLQRVRQDWATGQQQIGLFLNIERTRKYGSRIIAEKNTFTKGLQGLWDLKSPPLPAPLPELLYLLPMETVSGIVPEDLCTARNCWMSASLQFHFLGNYTLWKYVLWAELTLQSMPWSSSSSQSA